MRTIKQKFSGFTLIEVALSLALMAAILSAVYTSATYFIRSKQLIEDEADLQTVAESVIGRISKELSQTAKQISLLSDCDSSGTAKKSEYFNGKQQTIDGGNHADTITFIARGSGQYLPNNNGYTGPVQISYLIEKDEENNNRYSLFRQEWQMLRPQQRACESRIGFPITTQIVSLKFSYYKSDQQRWYDEWDGQQLPGIPDLVMFTIRLKSPLGKVRTYSSVVSTLGVR